MSCRHNKPDFTCSACGYMLILIAQKKGELKWLPKDINKLIFSMIERPKLLKFQLDPAYGLFKTQHACDGRCFGHSDQSLVKTLDIAFYGTHEQARGFAYGLIFRFNGEPEFWYHRDYVTQSRYSTYLDYYWMDSSRRVVWPAMDWMFSSGWPEEFLSGFSKAIDLKLIKINPKIDAGRQFEIWEPHVGSLMCSECKSDYIECNCANTAQVKCDHSVVLETIQKQHPCDVIYKLSEPHVILPVILPMIDPICTGITKSGTRCTYKAKLNGRCKIHM